MSESRIKQSLDLAQRLLKTVEENEPYDLREVQRDRLLVERGFGPGEFDRMHRRWNVMHAGWIVRRRAGRCRT